VTRRILLPSVCCPYRAEIRVDGCTQGVALNLTMSGLSGPVPALDRIDFSRKRRVQKKICLG